MTDVTLPANKKHKKSLTTLALRQQEAGSARLVAVALPASCNNPPIFYPSQIPIQILRLPEVISRVGICRASIYNRIAEGSFPKQISLGARAVGWLEHEIDAWLMLRMQARPSSPAVNLLTDH